MNDSISVTLSTTMPGGAFATLTPGAAGSSMPGLGGVFGQLLSLSAPAQPAAGADGQTLPTAGIALPLDSPEVGEQLAAILERYAGQTVSEDYLQQLRDEGITRESLAELADALEQSDIARMPAIAELVAELRKAATVLPDSSPQLDDEALGAEAETPVVASESVDTEQSNSGYAGPSVQAANAGSNQPAPEQQSAQSGVIETVEPIEKIAPVIGGQAGTSETVSAEKPAVPAAAEKAPVAPVAPVASGPEVIVSAEKQPAITDKLNQAFAAAERNVDSTPARSVASEVAAAASQRLGIEGATVDGQQRVPGAVAADRSTQQVSAEGRGAATQPPADAGSKAAGEAADRSAENARTEQSRPSQDAPVRPILAERTTPERITNTALAEFVRSQQVSAQQTGSTLQSDAEQLMTRLTEAAQQGRSSTSAGILQGLSRPDAQSQQLAQGRPAALPEGFAGGAERQPQAGVTVTRQATDAVYQDPRLSTANGASQPVAPSANAAVAPVDGEVSARQEALLTAQRQEQTTEQQRREPVQLVNPETRAQPESGPRPAATGPAFAVTPVADREAALMDASADAGTGRDDGRGRDSNAQAAALNSARQAEQSQQNTLHQLTMAGRPALNSPAWAGAMGQQVVWLAAQNNKVAEIQLDPPELGSLQVKIRVSQDQVSVSFTSPHAAVRDTVEQSIARLREMFEEQGLTLADASVDDQSAQQHAGDDLSEQQSGGGMAAAAEDEGDDTQAEGQAHSVSLVDYYA